MIKGIDVSRWQGDIDFNAVKESGIEFVIIKAGGSDDGLYEDSKFKENYSKAKVAGLEVGAYYFVGPDFLTEEDGIADAKRFLEIIGDREFTYPLVLDLETTRPEDKEAATNAALAFIKYLEDKNYFVSIYASEIYGFEERLNVERLKEVDKWVANYGSKPTMEMGMWQYSDSGKVPGISGNVDMNYSYKDYPGIIKEYALNRTRNYAAIIEEEREKTISFINTTMDNILTKIRGGLK